MSRWRPCSRRNFVRRLTNLGFDGPFSGTRRQFLVYQGHRLAIPSNVEYSVPQLRTMLRDVAGILGHEISAQEWSRLR